MSGYFCQVEEESGFSGRVKATERTTGEDVTILDSLENCATLRKGISHCQLALRWIGLSLTVWALASLLQVIFQVIFAVCLVTAFALNRRDWYVSASVATHLLYPLGRFHPTSLFRVMHLHTT